MKFFRANILCSLSHKVESLYQVRTLTFYFFQGKLYSFSLYPSSYLFLFQCCLWTVSSCFPKSPKGPLYFKNIYPCIEACGRVQDRVMIAITTMMVVATIQSSINKMVPKTSYLKVTNSREKTGSDCQGKSDPDPIHDKQPGSVLLRLNLVFYFFFQYKSQNT